MLPKTLIFSKIKFIHICGLFKYYHLKHFFLYFSRYSTHFKHNRSPIYIYIYKAYIGKRFLAIFEILISLLKSLLVSFQIGFNLS